jgi:anti-sigma factor RsiW
MHLGSRVSALLDGRLPAAEEERAWAHVHECNPCRDLVEREGWVKTRLAGLSMADRSACEAPDRLKSSLLGCGSALTPPQFPTSATTIRARHRSLVAIGGGAAGAAVFGVLALGAAGSPQLERRAPISDLTRPTQSATPTVNDRTADRTNKRTPKRQREARQDTSQRDQTSHVVVVSQAPRVTMAP